MPRLYPTLLTGVVERCLDNDPHDPTVQHRGRGHAIRGDNAEGKGIARLADTARRRSRLTYPRQITYDLITQVPESDLPALRDQILLLLKKFAAGPKPVRVQLCVCLAILAIQLRSWKDVLPTVVSALGSDAQSAGAILDFLRVLPEEVTEGRKINLSVRGSPDDDPITHSDTTVVF